MTPSERCARCGLSPKKHDIDEEGLPDSWQQPGDEKWLGSQRQLVKLPNGLKIYAWCPAFVPPKEKP